MQSLLDFLLAVLLTFGLLIFAIGIVFLFLLSVVLSLILGIIILPFVLIAFWLEDN